MAARQAKPQWTRRCWLGRIRSQRGSSHHNQNVRRNIQWRHQSSRRAQTETHATLMFVDPCIIVKVIQKNPTRCTSVSTFIIPYLYDAQHVSGDTPPIIRSLKLHWQPLICIILWKVVGHVVAGCCQAEYLCLTVSSSHTSSNLLQYYTNQRLLVQFLGSWWWAACHPKHVERHINME